MNEQATYATERRHGASIPTGTGLWWHHQHDGSSHGWQSWAWL